MSLRLINPQHMYTLPRPIPPDGVFVEYTWTYTYPGGDSTRQVSILSEDSLGSLESACHASIEYHVWSYDATFKEELPISTEEKSKTKDLMKSLSDSQLRAGILRFPADVSTLRNTDNVYFSLRDLAFEAIQRLTDVRETND